MGRGNKRGYKHQNKPMDGNKIRVRGKRLDEIDQTKLTLAYWLLAKQLVDDRTEPRLPTEPEVKKQAREGTADQQETQA